MNRYNHGFDVCFSIETDYEDYSQVTNSELIKALEARIRSLRAEFIDTDSLDLPASSAFGFMDTYEV
jgi:hypothetical protein